MTSKGTETAEEANQECCMCGDCGFRDQLFQCKICQFRYQHRYCSNVYPKAESYETCNMCLSQKVHHHVKDKSPNSSNSSSSSHNKNKGGANNNEESIEKGLNKRGSALQLQQQVLEKPIKKQRLPEAASPSTSSISTHNNIATNEALAERARRVKSVDIMNRNYGVKKQVYRNKVRRYKLLDELSC